MSRRLSGDARLLISGQAVRGFGYGLTAVALGSLLAARGVGPVRAGVFLATLIAGSAVASLVVGATADRFGRRRSYGVFFLAVAAVGAVVALNPPVWLLFVVAVTGTLSTDVVDNGAATTLEQVMLAHEDAGTGRVYGWYNAAGSACGALGSLGAVVAGAGASGAVARPWMFLVLVPVGVSGAVLAARLSPDVEAVASQSDGEGSSSPVRASSHGVVRRLALLFGVDAAGGGLVTTGFLSYYFSERYHVSLATLGWLFFTASAIQTLSVLAAPVIARRVGLLVTMVGTHLPSNVLLVSVAFAPNFAVAVTLLLARTTLSQMDVPTRQALVMAVTGPSERTAAAARTNAARYVVRPLGPLLGGLLQTVALGAPLLVAGVVKGGYDVALWRWARRLPALRSHARTPSTEEDRS